MLKDKIWNLVLELIDDRYLDMVREMRDNEENCDALNDIKNEIEDLAYELEQEIKEML